MANRLAVVVSQGQSAHPAKRGLEEEIVTALLMEPGVDVTLVPHLYDLKSDGTGTLALQGIKGDLIVMSWLYERAARWTLDRQGVRGLPGTTRIVQQQDSEEDEELEDEAAGAGDEKHRVADQRHVPQRRIYCVDLRVHSTAAPYVEEVRRILAEARLGLVQLGDWTSGLGTNEQQQRYLHPTNSTALPLVPLGAPLAARGGDGEASRHESLVAGVRDVQRVQDEPDRRWYPVIDYSRCTNCMECIDFCLFGVYGIDRSETILVEQPDNCRKGCPACSRVCPENAIIFPQHKTPAIAGAPVTLVGLKIDLSKLFGAPEDGKSAAEIAALERNEQLVLAGRQPVGETASMPKRQESRRPAEKDELDALLDELDQASL